MQLKWSSSADKRKTCRLNPMGKKPTRVGRVGLFPIGFSLSEARPSDAARSREDSFFSPSSQSPPQVLQALGPLHQFPDVRAAVLFDSQPGEILCVTSTPSADPVYYQLTFGGQQADWLNTCTNWVCGETITSTPHIIARAEGRGLQAMPPQLL